MRHIYIIHKGDFWGYKERESGEKKFKNLGIKEGERVTVNEFFRKNNLWNNKAKTLFQKECTVECFLYYTKGIYCDINIQSKNKKYHSQLKNRNIVFPPRLKRLWQKYVSLRHYWFIRSTHKMKKLIPSKIPSLKRIKNSLRAEVPSSIGILEKIINKDKSWKKRVGAVELLRFTKDKQSVIHILINSLDDSNHIVHNAAALVLIDFIREQKKIMIPIKPVLRLIFHQSTICRNKGAFLIYYIIRSAPSEIISIKINKRVLERLKDMEKARQPNNNIPAKKLMNLLTFSETKQVN